MKLAAFTIIDVLVAMALGSIVVALGLDGFEKFRTVVRANEGVQELRNNRSEIRTLIAVDCTSSDSLKEKNGELIIYGKQVIRYRMEENRILRTIGVHTDTLAIHGSLTFGYLDNTELVRTVEFSDLGGWEFRYVKDYRSIVLF